MVRLKLDGDTGSCLQHIIEVPHHKIVVIRLLTAHLTKHPSKT